MESAPIKHNFPAVQDGRDAVPIYWVADVTKAAKNTGAAYYYVVDPPPNPPPNVEPTPAYDATTNPLFVADPHTDSRPVYIVPAPTQQDAFSTAFDSGFGA